MTFMCCNRAVLVLEEVPQGIPLAMVSKVATVGGLWAPWETPGPCWQPGTTGF